MAGKRHAVPAATIVWVNIFLSSCALVKENRDPCPCRLEIRLTGTRGNATTVLVETPENVWSLSAASDTVLFANVPRGEVSVTAWSGAGEPSGGVFSIPSGTASPPLYLSRCRLVASGDEAVILARLRKQFCTLRVSVEGPPGWGTPFRTRIRGGVAGISADGVPVEGEFDYSPDMGACFGSSSPWTWTARLPRQYSGSPLFLDIVMEDSTVRTFSLGPCLYETGFDRSSPDLADLDLRQSLSVTSLTIRPPGWEPEVSLQVVI